jgi:hypothetical protein
MVGEARGLPHTDGMIGISMRRVERRESQITLFHAIGMRRSGLLTHILGMIEVVTRAPSPELEVAIEVAELDEQGKD